MHSLPNSQGGKDYSFSILFALALDFFSLLTSDPFFKLLFWAHADCSTVHILLLSICIGLNSHDAK